MELAWEIATGTPLWVYALFAFLVFRGIKAMRPGVGPLWRLAIIPAVFAAWGLHDLATQIGFGPETLGGWGAALVTGGAFGWLLTRHTSVAADKERGWIGLPGSAMTLVVILAIFAVNYTLGVVAAMSPDAMATPAFRIVDIAISGLGTGIFAGKFLQFRQKFAAAPHRDLTSRAG